MAAKYAKEVADRFSKNSGKAAVEPDEDDAEPDADDSATKGKALARAIKSGDGLAICEAVLAITGG